MSKERNQHRVQPIDPEYDTGAINRLLSEVRTKFALVPNLFRVLAHAPSRWKGWLLWAPHSPHLANL